MANSSSLVPELEAQGLNDPSGVRDSVLAGSNNSGDALPGNTAVEVPSERDSGDQLKSTSISSSSSYQNGTAASGDTLTWGVQSSWDGTDYSLRVISHQINMPL